MGAVRLSPARIGSSPRGPSRASTDLVVVPVVVEDRKGASVRTLRQEDFTLTEDGKPVAIETFVAPAAAAEGGMGADGRFVVVALDNITTPAEIAWRVKDIANYFVDRMGPADDLSVITLANGRASSGGGQEAARAAIRRFGPTIYTARTRAEVVAEGLQALESLTEQMAKSPHRRKVLAIIGASHMFNPSEPSAFYDVGPNLSVHWEGAVRNASRSNVSVYLIDPRGHTPMAEATSQTSPSSESSDASGARAERPPILRLFRRRHLGQLHQSDWRAGLGQHQQLQGRGRGHLARRRDLLPAWLPDAGQRPPAARHRSESASGRPEATSPPRPRLT